ncbi:MAG: hypothetical protein K2O06_11545 [Acetatifactor sp.]|nr:hypothetical protein [Acetatifactor sp.]
MSGPKTSRYTLTPEQRRILAQQRERDRRRAVALENIRRNSKRLLKIDGMFSSGKQVSAELIKRSEEDSGFLQKIKELEALTAQTASLASKVDEEDISALEKISEAMSKRLAEAEKMVRELSDIALQNEMKLRTGLNAAIDQGFTASFVNIEPDAEKSISDKRCRIREQLLQMKKNNMLPTELLEEIDDAVSEIDNIQEEIFLKNYSALTVSPLIKECERFLSEYQKYHVEFDRLYSEYSALCELYYYTAQEYSCSAVSVESLKAEIQRIKENAAREDEQSYISQCLDEVMEEMGYIVLGSRQVTKKNGKHFRNELYSCGEGTAVNVTYSSDGRIAMELGGIDTSDRLPNDREASILCDSMERFCDDFKEVERRLLAKGVIPAERISLLPPSAEYAQIINISDYDMKGEAEKLKAVKGRKTAVDKFQKEGVRW